MPATPEFAHLVEGAGAGGLEPFGVTLDGDVEHEAEVVGAVLQWASSELNDYGHGSDSDAMMWVRSVDVPLLRERRKGRYITT